MPDSLYMFNLIYINSGNGRTILIILLQNSFYSLIKTFLYSPTSKFLGDIFLILSDNRHAMPNDRSISAIPASVEKATGMLKVHLTIPIELKNNDISGLITRQLTIMPTTVDRIIAGINESAVCKMSCPVVNPKDLSIP